MLHENGFLRIPTAEIDVNTDAFVFFRDCKFSGREAEREARNFRRPAFELPVNENFRTGGAGPSSP